MYAVGGNTECARLSGVNVNKVKRMIYVLNAGMAWVAGVFVAFRMPDISVICPTFAGGKLIG